jgi:hypothetical protein
VREGGATAQRRAPAAGLCPRCGEPFDAEQEYCLECGLRLPWDSALFAKLAARAASGGRSRGVPRAWVWPALLALVVAAAGAAVAIVLTTDDEPGAAFAVATGGNRPAAADTSTLPTPPEPTGSTTTPRAGAQTPPARRPGLVRWPRGRNGWTIVLISLPQQGGGAPARAKAQEALTKGLREVGVIDSNRFASLHPGYYVVFTGVYASPEEAASSLQRAKAAFPLAYTREIAS